MFFIENWGRRFFRGWKKKRDSEGMRNELFEEHIRRRRFVNKIFCDGIIGGGCKGRRNRFIYLFGKVRGTIVYSEWRLRPLSSETRHPINIQFTGCQ